LKDKKVLDLNRGIFFNALVLEMKRGKDGKRTPVGVINKRFDSKQAVIIHLADFSIWVARKFEEGTLMAKCAWYQDQDLSSFYEQMDIKIHDFSDHIYNHSYMRDELINNPKRITVAYYHHIKRTCQHEYHNAGQEQLEVNLIRFLPQEMQEGKPPRPERSTLLKNKRPANNLLLRELLENEADDPVTEAHEMIKTHAQRGLLQGPSNARDLGDASEQSALELGGNIIE